MNTRNILPLFVAIVTMAGFQANAAQGTAKAKMKVTTALQITKTSDLIFTEAAAGAAAETVNADTTETAGNASFAVVGEPGKAVTVNLPADGTVNMVVNGGATSDEIIPVNAFTASPLSNIDSSGTSNLYVGATRAALSNTQASGDYEGDFVVEVIY